MAEKLSITIALEGAAEIEQQLEGIGQAGTKAFEDIAKAAEKTGGFDKLDPKDVQAKLEKFGVTGKAAIDKITAAVAQAGRLERIVGGIRAVEDGFAKIGVAASAMSQRVTTAFTAIGTAAASTGGAIGRVGRALGILGSGALIGSVGAAVVGMEQAADAARVLEGNLQAVFRNAAAGTALFNQIQQSARDAGTSLESTGRVMLDFVRILQAGLKAKGISFAPGEGFKQITTEAQQFVDTLQKGMKLSGTRADDANKAIAALNSEFKKTGQLSGDTLRKLAADFPQLANELVKFLGVPGQTMEQLADQVDRGIRKVDIPKFTNAVKQATPAIQGLSDAFDPTLAQRIDTISGGWNRLLDSFGKSPAGAAIKAAMDDIAKGLDEIARKQGEVGKFTVDKPSATVTGAFLDEVFKTIETTKKEWQGLVNLINGTTLNEIKLSDVFSFSFDSNKLDQTLTTIEMAIIRWGDKIRDKIKSIFQVQPETQEGAPQQPAWVEAYLGWIAKVKAAFLAMFTKTPEQGGQLGGQAVPFLGGQIPADVVARGAARIEDRRGEGLDTTAITTALTELATAAQGATQSLQGLQGLEFLSIAAAVDAFNTAISSVADSVQSLSFSDMMQAFADATAAAQQLGTDFQNMGLSAVASAMQEVTSAANSAAEALGSIGSGGGGGGDLSEFARGGQVFGRAGRDKIPAYLTRDEWVMRAAAVKKYGTAFMRAINEGRLNLPRFNLGGLVDDMSRSLSSSLMIPRFDTGGLATLQPARAGSARTPITLVLNGNTIGGLSGSDNAVSQLRRVAVSDQVVSAGRKPNWVR